MAEPACKRRTVNLFMVYSPLHCLCADHIVRNFERGARNILFYLKQGYDSFVDSSLWDGIHYLPWPRFNPAPGPFGRLRRTMSNLEFVARQCQGADTIRLHATVIDTEAVNYNINYLQRHFPHAEFSVRLFPDGVLNLRRHPLGRVKEMMQYLRAARTFVSPALRYHRLKGDRIGSDEAIVDRIYLLPGLPHEYETSKTVVLPEFTMSSAKGSDIPGERKALVIGQPLVVYRRMTASDMAMVAVGMKAFLEAQGVTRILYKPHPRDQQREYAVSGYEDLLLDKPLELHFAEEHYPIVIGVCSTALLTARMILPPSSRVIAYGLDRFIFRGEKDRATLLGALQEIEVEIVSHDSIGTGKGTV